jgi:hypothetical protein
LKFAEMPLTAKSVHKFVKRCCSKSTKVGNSPACLGLGCI